MFASRTGKAGTKSLVDAQGPSPPRHAPPPAPGYAGNQAALRGLGQSQMPKLLVEPTGAAAEHDAEQVAQQAIQGQGRLAPTVLPASADNAEPAPANVHEVLAAPGAPLDAAVRAHFEPRFGQSFADVRIHTDGAAQNSARFLGARAYAAGTHIVFAENPAPGSPRARQLLAHELAHVAQQRGETMRLNRDTGAGAAPAAKTPAPAAGGNILYIGMNAFPLEVAALKARYRNKTALVTTVTRTDDTAHTATKGGTFDLTGDSGINDFVTTLALDKARTDALVALLKDHPNPDRDDLAHVIDVYAQTDGDGMDRMSRVVLSGHSYGTLIYGHAEQKGAEISHINFADLVTLAKVFPKAAGQTRHLLVSACVAGAEDNMRRYYLPAYPNLLTFTGYTSLSPSGQGSATAVADWARTNWASGDYKGDDKISGLRRMANLRADEATFSEYLAGTKTDADAHAGWLTNYYAQARAADLNVTEITGADHVYAHSRAEQSFRLRFWSAQVGNFWKYNEAKLRAGYGSAAVPNYGKMSRKDALQAIADFAKLANGGPGDVAAAKLVLDALKNLDESVMKADWIEPVQ